MSLQIIRIVCNRVGNRTLQSTGQVDVEERSVETVHHGHLGPIPVCFAFREIEIEFALLAAIVRRIGALRLMLHRLGLLEVVLDVVVLGLVLEAVLLGFALMVHHFRVRSRRGTAFDFGHAEYRLPPLEPALRGRSGISKPGRCESSLGPSVVDVSEMPLDSIRRRIEVELVADIDHVLDRRHIHIVDRREIENNGSKGREMRPIGFGLALTRTGVVPWSVPGLGVAEGVRTAGIAEDGLDKEVRVVVGIGIIEPFGESVDEDPGVWLFHLDLRV